MSGILCVWANLPDATTSWYEKEYVPITCSKNAIHAIHCEQTSNGMEDEPVGKLDSPWDLFTVYEIAEIENATEEWYDTRTRSSDHPLAGKLKGSRFDTRSYREVKRWQAEDWKGDVASVVSIAVMEWRISSDMVSEVLDFYVSTVGPKISSSPDVLRFRFFEIDNAIVSEGGSCVTKDKEALPTYFTLVELESEHWPWDVVVELAENKEWKLFFEAQTIVKWQFSHYLVKNTYPVGVDAQETNIETNVV